MKCILTPPGLPSDAVTTRVYWSVLSLSKGFPRSRRPMLGKKNEQQKISLHAHEDKTQRGSAGEHSGCFSHTQRGCSLEFVYREMRRICKTRLMTGEDEFREESRWHFKCSHSVSLPPEASRSIDANTRTHTDTGTQSLPFPTDRSRRSLQPPAHNLALRDSKCEHNTFEFPSSGAELSLLAHTGHAWAKNNLSVQEEFWRKHKWEEER